MPVHASQPALSPPPFFCDCTRRREGYARTECLRLYLERRGHPQSTIGIYASCAEHFERWFTGKSPVDTLPDEAAIHAFVTQHLPSCSCPPPAPAHPRNVHAALNHLLAALRCSGSIPPRPAPPPTHLGNELDPRHRLQGTRLEVGKSRLAYHEEARAVRHQEGLRMIILECRGSPALGLAPSHQV